MVDSRPNRVRIHVHDDARALDGTHALIRLATSAHALEDALCAMCTLVAQIATVDVVSVYLRERRAGSERLVLRGNVGFPASAIGRVELALSEGLTGVVAERRRPVSVATAQHDRRYKHVDGIGEENFPAFLGVPLLDGAEVVGVLVLQRRRPVRFTHADVALASSLTAAFIIAMQRRPAVLPALQGHAVVDGTALGPAVVLGLAPPAPSWPDASQVLELDLAAATHRLRLSRATEIVRALDNLTLVTHALRDHANDPDVLHALERVPFRTACGAHSLATLLAQRRAELCDLARLLACDHPLAGAVLVVPRIGALLALEAVARDVGAVLCAESIAHDAAEILRAAGVPSIGAVAGLDEQLQGGAMLEIDATRGQIRFAEL